MYFSTNHELEMKIDIGKSATKEHGWVSEIMAMIFSQSLDITLDFI
jgi:hypothetical protein